MMKTAFALDSRLTADTFAVTTLALSELRLMNDCRWPWFILIPKIADAEEIHHLEVDDQLELFQEINCVALALDAMTACSKINIGVLGNVVRQLHVHIVARNQHDTNWPSPVWGLAGATPYEETSAEALIAKMRQRLD